MLPPTTLEKLNDINNHSFEGFVQPWKFTNEDIIYINYLDHLNDETLQQNVTPQENNETLQQKNKTRQQNNETQTLQQQDEALQQNDEAVQRLCETIQCINDVEILRLVNEMFPNQQVDKDLSVAVDRYRHFRPTDDAPCCNPRDVNPEPQSVMRRPSLNLVLDEPASSPPQPLIPLLLACPPETLTWFHHAPPPSEPSFSQNSKRRLQTDDEPKSRKKPRQRNIDHRQSQNYIQPVASSSRATLESEDDEHHWIGQSHDKSQAQKEQLERELEELYNGDSTRCHSYPFVERELPRKKPTPPKRRSPLRTESRRPHSKPKAKAEPQDEYLPAEAGAKDERKLCPIPGCGQRLSRRQDMPRHLATHQHVYMYECLGCGKEYRDRKDSWRRHAKKHGCVGYKKVRIN
ncbi:hypothetical protein C8J56DRAFT_1116452 [Mycena floridula]|nr:hypothetical protein C8J56DRAFT_1116452 [Mycena floridula]